MRTLLPDDIPLVVSRRKHRGLRELQRQTDVDLVLVDDALQTAQLPVDRHLVLLDAERPLGNGHLLPAGRLREPPAAVRRAAALLFTRSPDGRFAEHVLWKERQADCFVARESAGALRRVDGSVVDIGMLQGRGVATLCGLGRPQAFETLVRRLAGEHGFSVRRCVRVPDHAPLERRLHKLRDRLEVLGCESILVTQKDACRLREPDANEPLLVLEQRLEIEAIDELLEKLGPTLCSDQSSSA
jgi:tetraacyldisaccharide 4'-kinase